MTDSVESKKIVESVYKNIKAQEFDKVVGLIDPQVKISEPMFLPYGGDYQGLEGFNDLLPKILQFIDVFSIEVDTIIADGENVVALLRAPSASGETELQFAEHFVVRDGKIVSIKLFFHKFE